MKSNKKRMFFIEQDRMLNRLIDKLIEFRLGLKDNQKKEIKDIFHSIATQASKFGYKELSELGKYYESYIDSIQDIDDNSHQIFSNILRGIGIIRKDIEQLRTKNNKDRISLNSEVIPKNNNILLLDDDRLISAVLKDAFEEEGYNMITTTNHEEAIENILYNDINIALIDIIMPKMNGFEVFDILKKSGVDIPIIFLSGRSLIHYKVDALSMGVDDYITKPFEIKEVIARVERSLGRSNKYKNKLNKDKLTCAYTKQYFNKSISNIINGKKYLEQDFAVAFIDLDDFKYINDSYGHIIGDYALRDFAGFLIDNLGENDMLFRFGGDEFIVIFENKCIKDAYENIENLRIKLNKTKFKYEDIEDELKLNVSIGITYLEEYDSVESILSRADQCLYKSKELGKNTTICSDYIKAK